MALFSHIRIRDTCTHPCTSQNRGRIKDGRGVPSGDGILARHTDILTIGIRRLCTWHMIPS